MRLVAMVLVGCCVLAGCSAKTESQSTPRPPPAESTGTAPRAASQPAMTALEIIERSEQAMAGTLTVLEELSWRRNEGHPTEHGIEVTLVDGTRMKNLWRGELPGLCEPYERRAPLLENRHEGALAIYRGHGGASAPEEYELLGSESIEGREAWVVRYRYTYPSIEGPFPAEHTEWIDKETFRLLRSEIETYDPFGFVGQTVVVYRQVDSEPDCPLAPVSAVADLRPATAPRLESPYR